MNRRLISSEFLVLLRSLTLAAGFLCGLTGLPAFGQSGCANFPANYVPFSNISYVTAPNAAGDRLVVGSLAGGFNSFGNAIQNPATSINQEFCNAVQLSAQQSYPNVYVPTAAEKSGNFSAFAGLLVNPATNQAYQNGIIPASQLGNPYYAWRIAPNALNITSVQNAASNITPGLPNAGIAQGAIFVVQGANLGPATISITNAAFQNTTLSNTSVAVTVGGTTVSAPMYYTSAGQVAALLPSNTPTGTGTIAVTYNNQTSASIPITVVANNLGLFSIDSSGSGPGIVTFPDYSLVSAAKIAGCGGPNTECGSANPGDTLILWATGLGPVNGSDAAGAGLGQAINVPLTLWLGGVQAPVTYQGRSGCCIGEDQIVFTVPNNVPTGCAVPLLIQINNEISNNTVMPVAATGSRNCTPTNAAYASVNLEQGVVAGPISVGNIKVDHYSDGNGTFEDDGKAQFQTLLTYSPGSQPFLISWVDYPPSGTCLVYNNLNENTNTPVTSVASLDAGPTVKLTGPNGSVSLPENKSSNEFNPGNFLVPGVLTVTGTGGAKVGSFSGTLTIPASPTLVSPVINGSATRSNGLTVTWTGGSSGTVVMELASCTDGSCTNGAVAACSAPASAGTFTIPPYVLMAVPAGNNGGFVLSTQAQSSFTATGLNLGAITLDRYNVAGFGYGWGSGGFTLK
jgi:uncharacterized protein (TIGR03437 family)